VDSPRQPNLRVCHQRRAGPESERGASGIPGEHRAGGSRDDQSDLRLVRRWNSDSPHPGRLEAEGHPAPRAGSWRVGAIRRILAIQSTPASWCGAERSNGGDPAHARKRSVSSLGSVADAASARPADRVRRTVGERAGTPRGYGLAPQRGPPTRPLIAPRAPRRRSRDGRCSRVS
jgi:hypothetical protein